MLILNLHHCLQDDCVRSSIRNDPVTYNGRTFHWNTSDGVDIRQMERDHRGVDIVVSSALDQDGPDV